MSIRSRSTLGLASFDEALVPDDEGEVIIDLSQLEFIDVYGLVGLAAHLIESTLNRRAIKLLVPQSTNASNYLARMHLGDLLEACDVKLSRPLPVVRETDQRESLIELQTFEDVRGSERLADYLWARLDGQVPGQIATQIYEAAGELGNNVVDHSRCPVGGFMAAQRHKRGKPEEHLIVAVGDAGIGIQASLRERYGDLDETEAIRQALEPGVSGIEDPGRGRGLSEIVEGVTGFGGVVRVRSGSAARRVTRNGASSEKVSYLRGTIVGAKVLCRPGR